MGRLGVEVKLIMLEDAVSVLVREPIHSDRRFIPARLIVSSASYHEL